MKFLTQLLVSALAVIVSSLILPGVHLDGALTAIIVAAVLAFMNSIVKPVLVLLTIPITLISLGFFLLVINAVIILITSKLVGPSFTVSGFWTALLFSLVLTIVTSVFNSLGKKAED